MALRIVCAYIYNPVVLRHTPENVIWGGGRTFTFTPTAPRA